MGPQHTTHSSELSITSQDSRGGGGDHTQGLQPTQAQIWACYAQNGNPVFSKEQNTLVGGCMVEGCMVEGCMVGKVMVGGWRCVR